MQWTLVSIVRTGLSTIRSTPDRSREMEDGVGLVDELGNGRAGSGRLNRVRERGCRLEVPDVVHRTGGEVIEDMDRSPRASSSSAR